MTCLFELAESVAPVAPSTLGAVVYERFEREPGLLNIAVVDDDGWPLGLVERNAFSLKMASQFGRALYAGRPIVLLMEGEPHLVDGSILVDDYMQDTLVECPANLLRGFIVTREGRYVGVGSALSLLQAQTASVRSHAIQAQAALRAKSEFLAVMSHEIRTPLNGVLAVADLVRRQLRQPELRSLVQTIIDSGETLLRMLNDALDLSRAEAGRLELAPAPFRPAALVEDIDALWRPRAGEVGLNLVTRFEGDPEILLMGDAVRLKQILNNLVGNALKFTASGAVEVRVAVRAGAAGLVLSGQVSDTGAGIPEDQVDDLFVAFSQTDVGRLAGGAGLGLSICRQLTERMGGTIRVDSQMGQGSVFTFEVPLEACEAAPSAPDVAAPDLDQAMLHVLIADDNATNRLVAQTLCDLFGCTFESVENGAEAVALAEAGRFDIVLMDIKMPVMDGVEATHKIRALSAPTPTAPIIALTAIADPREAQRYLAAGMDAVVEKPI
ncbi:MAG: ATP-binding protein, partial [Caulobacteraceae bacterium]|nr:ATP-binding protein [Caulobacteraceae bacterium]